MRASHQPSSTKPRQGEAPARVSVHNNRIALAIFVIAFAARLIFLFTSPDREWPHSIFYEGDAIVWVEWASQVDQGLPFQFGLPIHPPGVAYPLAWLYDGVRQTGFVGMKALWCAMSAAACGLTFLACAHAVGRRIGVLAALLLAFSFNQYVLATSLNSETPYVFLLTAIVVMTQRSVVAPSRWRFAGLGALHGAALLLRPEHPVLMAMYIAWLALANRTHFSRSNLGAATMPTSLPLRTRLIGIALVCAGALLVCLPWTVHAVRATQRFNTLEPNPIHFNLAPIEWTDSARAALLALPAFARNDNYIVINVWAQQRGLDTVEAADVTRFALDQFGWLPRRLSPFVLISNQGAFSFALANHPQADGGFSRAALAHPIRGKDPTFAFAFPPHNRIFTDGWRVGWRYITHDPGAWAQNVNRKFQRFADGVTCGFGAANAPLGRSGVREPVDMLVADNLAAITWQVVIVTVIFAGALISVIRRVPIDLWMLAILYKLIITLLFYGYARQGASIAPVFCILIAIAVDSILLPVDRRFPGWIGRQAIVAAAMCAMMLATDLIWSRRNEQVTIIGQTFTRPDLGAGAFQAFNRIEVRAMP